MRTAAIDARLQRLERSLSTHTRSGLIVYSHLDDIPGLIADAESLGRLDGVGCLLILPDNETDAEVWEAAVRAYRALIPKAPSPPEPAPPLVPTPD